MLVKAETTRNPLCENKRRFTQRLASGGHFSCDIDSSCDGMIVLKVSGESADRLFSQESGGHRWQRIPPNDRSGRVHSSTVTVAVTKEPGGQQFHVEESDLEYTTCRGSGPGGQKRNKTESAVQVKHKPSGLYVRCDSERSQGQNKESAKTLLISRLMEAASKKAGNIARDDRWQQVGSGERSDKIRTVQTQNGQVVNNITGKKCNIESYLKGDIWKIS